jgi:hypothetical protein
MISNSVSRVLKYGRSDSFFFSQLFRSLPFTVMSEASVIQWVVLGVGALVSYFVMNWLSTPSPKKFVVDVPEGSI